MAALLVDSEVDGYAHVTSSFLGRFFELDCDRFLWFNVHHDNSDRKRRVDEQSFGQARINRGLAFEDTLCELLETDLGDFELVKLVDHQQDTPRLTMELLENVEGSMILYQSAFRMVKEWQQVEFGLAKPDFLFIDERENELKVVVIDAKSSAKVKLGHLVQLGMYLLYMEENFELINRKRIARGLKPLTLSHFGGIWLPHQHQKWVGSNWSIETGPIMSNLTNIRENVKHFLTHDLLDVIREQRVGNIPWQLNERCKQCEFYSKTCFPEVASSDPPLLSGMPYLPKQDFMWLRSLGAETIQDIEDMYHNINDPKDTIRKELERVLGGPTLPMRRAFAGGTKQIQLKFCRSSRTFPKTEAVRLIVTVVGDPNHVDSGRLFAWGFGIYLSSTRATTIYTDSIQDSNLPYEEQLDKFFKALYEAVIPHQDSEFSCAFYSEKEWKLMESILKTYTSPEMIGLGELFGMLPTIAISTEDEAKPKTKTDYMTKMAKDEILREFEAIGGDFITHFCTQFADDKTLFSAKKEGQLILKGKRFCVYLHTIYTYLRRVGLITDPNWTSNHQLSGLLSMLSRANKQKAQDGVKFHVFFVDHVVRTHFVAPIFGFYTLTNLGRLLLHGHEHRDQDVEDESIFKTPSLTRVRLDHINSLVTILRREVGHQVGQVAAQEMWPKLYFSAPTFSGFQANHRRHIHDPSLWDLVIEEQKEVLLTCRKLQSERVELPLSDQLELGKALMVEFVRHDEDKQYVFKLCEESDHIILTEDAAPIKQWIIVPNNERGRDFAAKYDDFARMNDMFGSNLGSIVSVWSGDDMTTFVSIDLNAAYERMFRFKFPGEAQVGTTFLMFKRFTNFGQIERIVGEVQRLDNLLQDGEETPLFPILLGETSTIEHGGGFWDNRSTLEPRFNTQDVEMEQLGLGQSQIRAMQACFENHLQCIFGGPGSGKTYFLGCTLYKLMQTSERKLRILIASSTNSAIDTCLKTLQDVIHDRGMRDATLLRLGTNHDPENDDGFAWVKPDGFRFDKYDQHVVVASTPWQTCKLPFVKEERFHDSSFDVVVIDEGSQVPMAHASLVIRLLSRKGRLIVAGDINQLQPVRQSTSGTEISILSRLMPNGHEFPSYVSVLRENFRMNAELAEFTKHIYGSDYCAVPGNLHRRLNINSSKLENHLNGNPLKESVRSLMNPDQALAMAWVPEREMERCTVDQAAVLEAGVVKELVLAFMNSFEEDGWKSKLTIITPHHVQRRAIRKALQTIDPDREIFVDTVEKAQGSSFELVIVCLGFFSSQYLDREVPFLFYMHRLNVALTRARSKCIVTSCFSEVQHLNKIYHTADSVVRGIDLFRKLLEHVVASKSLFCCS